jgi:hypothetical protein
MKEKNYPTKGIISQCIFSENFRIPYHPNSAKRLKFSPSHTVLEVGEIKREISYLGNARRRGQAFDQIFAFHH